MRVVLLCGTQRGHRFLKKLTDLLPHAEIAVLSFREESWEPPFLDEIRQLALSRGAQFYESRHVGSSRYQYLLDDAPVDLMMAVNWRYMIPARVFGQARLGAFVFHDSLLPAYRGFSPTVWAIINGEDHTGVTMFEMSEEMDAGPIVDQARVAIEPDDTIATVMNRVTEAYLCILEANLAGLIDGSAPRCPQDHSQANYTCKRLPEDNVIDWNMSSQQILNLVRGVSRPYTGAYTHLQGQRMVVWSARLLRDGPRYVGSIPGRVAKVISGEGSVVLTSDGALLLTEVQTEGGPAASADEVLSRLDQTLGR